MQKEETSRQRKVASQIQKDISDILLRECHDMLRGVMVSVSSVRMSPDLALAKVYISVFPFSHSAEVQKRLKSAVPMIRGELGRRVRNQLRIVPEIAFFVDDSLEYVENLDRLIKL